MYLFHTGTSDKIFHCVVDYVCDVNLIKFNINLLHVQAMEGWYILMELSSIERFIFF